MKCCLCLRKDNPDEDIYSLELKDDILYVAGNFSDLDGAGFPPREYLASFNINTGVTTTWAPVFNNEVDALVILGNTLYVGGNFGTVDTQSRSKVAAYDLSTMLLTSWNPHLENGRSNNYVWDGLVSQDNLGDMEDGQITSPTANN